MTSAVTIAVRECGDKSCPERETRTSYYFSFLLLRIILLALFLCLTVVGLLSYFRRLPEGFSVDDLSLFLSCFFIAQLLWHYFSLFELRDEGVLRNRQSVWMFFCPNRILISSLTVFLAVIAFYWNYLFVPDKMTFIAVIFLVIFLPQLFVRIWDVILQKDTSMLAGLIAMILVLLILSEEIRYGLGFRYMTAQLEKVSQLESKPGKPEGWNIPVPDSPRWQRDGLTYYPQLFEVLNDAGFEVDKDTHLALTPQAKKLFAMGIIPFNHYQGKAFSGLKITDRHNKVLYQYQHPNQFKDFKHIPQFILKALLVWENDKLRHLLLDKKQGVVDLNYLIEGPRIIKSISEYVKYKITGEGSYSGGSTLMTTLEKITNTPGGRTQSVTDKINQMIGAGLHLYGENVQMQTGGRNEKSNEHGQNIENALVDFLNTVPMAGGPRSYSGELFGFGTAYYAWFGHTIDELNEQLKGKDRQLRAQAFKNICSLIVAIRRPSELLLAPEKVAQQANLLLSRLKQKQLINSALYVKARRVEPVWNPQARQPYLLDYALHREASSARNQYTHLVRQAVARKSNTTTNTIAVKNINLQTVDAMPVAIEMTTDLQLETDIRRVLDDMYTEVAQKSPFVQGQQTGLLYSLSQEELKQIEYGVIVLQIEPQGQWKILVNTDTQSRVIYNPASQGRFQWGSTAKLRVLVNYLMIVHDEALLLQKAQRELSKKSLAKLMKQYRGSFVMIKRLLASYLNKHPQASMEKILNWAMSRRISASPAKKFLTAQSWHEFHNYQKSDDRKMPDLWQMTSESINLSFVRLMRDVVDYYIDQRGYDKIAILMNKNNPVRKKIIADALAKDEAFYHQGLNFFIAAIQDVFTQNKDMSDKEILHSARNIVQQLSQQAIKKTAKKAGPYHNLASWFKRITYYEKKWLLAHVRQQNNEYYASIATEDKRIVQQASVWQRNNRNWIKTTLYTYMEREAFAHGITPAWQKLGYPFKVSPSYAVVLGSSGDTPMSLIELAGTLLNDGVHEKNLSAIERIILSPNSEFETPFKIKQQQELIIPPAVARVAKKAMEGVLHKGTAIFASRHPLMKYVASAGAKTGTGDNRHNQRPVNRSAAVISVLDSGQGQAKYAICVTMSVTKGDIERYKFTSKIPVRILSRIADYLTPVVAQKSLSEVKVELAVKAGKGSRKQHLAQISPALKLKRHKFHNHKSNESAHEMIDDSVQLVKSLF